MRGACLGLSGLMAQHCPYIAQESWAGKRKRKMRMKMKSPINRHTNQSIV